MKRLILMGLLSGGVPGCAPGAARFLGSTATAISAKPDECAIRVLATLPGPGYREIGVIEWADIDLTRYKQKVHALVCRAGGDLVATQLSDEGMVVRGVVFRESAMELR